MKMKALREQFEKRRVEKVKSKPQKGDEGQDEESDHSKGPIISTKQASKQFMI